MFGWNRTDIIGNIGGKVELRFTPSGKPFASFSVACNRRFTNKEGEKKEATEWFTVTTWNKLAESCNTYLKKGSLVFVSGRVSLHKWERSDGNEGSRLELNAGSVVFLEKNGRESVLPESIDAEDRPYYMDN